MRRAIRCDHLYILNNLREAHFLFWRGESRKRKTDSQKTKADR